jgi:hypothetical protein
MMDRRFLASSSQFTIYRDESMTGPDFIGIGQQKAGTGWLYHQLSNHPDFWMPPVKELHFFDRGFNFHRARNRLNGILKMSEPNGTRSWRNRVEMNPDSERGVLDELEYDLEFFRLALLTKLARRQQHLKKTRGNDDGEFAENLDSRQLEFYTSLFGVTNRLTGDITPAYAVLSPKAIQLISNTFVNTKYILQIRHPVSRTISHIRHYYRNGKFNEQSFANADAMANLLAAYPQFVANSLCSTIYENWSSQIDPNKLLLMSLEDIIAHPDETRQKLAEFLSVDDAGFSIPSDYNRKKDHFKVDIPGESIEYLEQFFEVEVSRCQDVFEDHCTNWK